MALAEWLRPVMDLPLPDTFEHQCPQCGRRSTLNISEAKRREQLIEAAVENRGREMDALLASPAGQQALLMAQLDAEEAANQRELDRERDAREQAREDLREVQERHPASPLWGVVVEEGRK